MSSHVHMDCETSAASNDPADGQSRTAALRPEPSSDKNVAELSKLLDLAEKNLKYWQERYTRLLEDHRKLLNVNQNLEDKLINIVDSNQRNVMQLQETNQRLNAELQEAQLRLNNIEQMNRINEQNCKAAVDIIQSKPKEFIAGQNLASFTEDLQIKLKALDISKDQSANIPPPLTNRAPSTQQQRHVMMPTFPPMAMMYTDNRSEQQPVHELPVTPATEATNYDYSSSPDQKGSVMTV